ncbi:MAG: hypothetical protein GC155_11770 [Alphaproteobacteria bacterium]|nr:hypothetical protein [Alphaproteobacteria bacterium]
MRDRDLMTVKLKDLKLSVEGTWLEDRFAQLNRELSSRGLLVQAHSWVSNEWFSPDTTPGIAVPFYLAHPRLIRLERRMMLDVEGGTRRECMQILRHEAGHVVQHAYGLHRRRKWQMAFGRSSKPYPNYYRPNPSSQNYVQHLRRWYAQSHPDEDFAETFAVWLTPRSNWRKRYADWPALKKLLYVDELMSEIAGEKPILTRRAEVDPISKMNETLDSHYQAKLQHYAAAETSATFDRDLLKIFSRESQASDAPLATTFIRRNRAEIRQLVSKWTGEYQLTLDAVLDDISDRCRALKLRAPGSERKLRLNLTAMLTKRAVHSFYSSSRRQRFAV